MNQFINKGNLYNLTYVLSMQGSLRGTGNSYSQNKSIMLVHICKYLSLVMTHYYCYCNNAVRSFVFAWRKHYHNTDSVNFFGEISLYTDEKKLIIMVIF